MVKVERCMSGVFISALLIIISMGIWDVIYLYADSKQKTQESAYIKCYSGGRVFFEGQSIGRIYGDANSGYVLTDSRERKKIQVTGSCVIIYNY